jgi:hypothetical protein
MQRPAHVLVWMVETPVWLPVHVVQHGGGDR